MNEKNITAKPLYLKYQGKIDLNEEYKDLCIIFWVVLQEQGNRTQK